MNKLKYFDLEGSCKTNTDKIVTKGPYTNCYAWLFFYKKAVYERLATKCCNVHALAKSNLSSKVYAK